MTDFTLVEWRARALIQGKLAQELQETMDRRIADAVAAERERCAKIAENPPIEVIVGSTIKSIFNGIAAAIRRGE